MIQITVAKIETPALLIDLDALESNIQRMADFMRDKSAQLRPHFKSNKCPTIAHKQLAAGAKGITCAKLGEAEVLVNAGVNDVLIANQVVDPAKLYRLAGLARGDAKITVAADNPQNVDDLSRAATTIGSTLHVLVEVDVGMGRCGVTNAGDALALARRIDQSPGLVFEGLQAYEGHLVHCVSLSERKRRVAEMVAFVSQVKETIEAGGLAVHEISGAGTGTYAITGDNTPWTEIQAGSYVFMDSTYGGVEGLPFAQSLSILTTVIHKRPGYAVTDAGLKVCATDMGAPIIKGHANVQVIGHLSEEHGKLADPDDELSYRQLIEYIPGHCCTTVNLHDHFYCVRNGLLEAMWPISGRGRSQ